MVVHLVFVLYSTNILLSEHFVLPEVTIQIHNHHRSCRERAKLHSSVIKESQQKFCGSKPCPASPCSQLTLAAPASGLPSSQLWKRYSVSIRYHLVVRTAPAQTAVGQIPYSLLGSQAPKLYLTVSG